MSGDKAWVTEALLILHSVGHACYENTGANKEAFSPPPLDWSGGGFHKGADISASLGRRALLEETNLLIRGFSENIPG